MTRLKCPKCGIEGDGKFCSKCGSPLSQGAKTAGQIPWTLEGKSGRIELMETSVKIVLYKKRFWTRMPEWDSSKISKIHEISRDSVTKTELVKLLGQNQFNIHFLGASFFGFVTIFVKEEQIPEAKKMIDMLTRIKASTIPQDSGIEIEPQSAEAWFDKGTALLRVAFNHPLRYDEAITAYEEAIRLDPQYAAAWSSKGVALNGLGKHDEAIQACDEAIKLNPSDDTAEHFKGMALEKLGKHAEAQQATSRAVEIDPAWAAPATSTPKIKIVTYKNAQEASKDANILAASGWIPQSTAATDGHLNLGRTVFDVALMGPLGLLGGGSRTKGSITVRYVKK
jgi:tetratricopeptide (TPR) repeat protein